MEFFKKTLEKARRAIERVKSKFDKNGAYTGTPSDGSEEPEQDADDL